MRDAVEVVVVGGDELADLVDEQPEAHAAEQRARRPRHRPGERQQHDECQRHQQPAPQHVRDVQAVAADLRVVRRSEERPREQHGHHSGHDEPRQMRGRRWVPREPEPQQAFHRLRFSRTRTEIWMGEPSNPNVSRRRRSMNRR
jgi:hypothetical protein